MRKLVFALDLREADASHELAGYVDHRSDLDTDLLVFLEVFIHRGFELLFVAADEESGDVMRVRELPVSLGCHRSDHRFEVIDECLGFACLCEGADEELAQLALIVRVALDTNSKEGWQLASCRQRFRRGLLGFRLYHGYGAHLLLLHLWLSGLHLILLMGLG